MPSRRPSERRKRLGCGIIRDGARSGAVCNFFSILSRGLDTEHPALDRSCASVMCRMLRHDPALKVTKAHASAEGMWVGTCRCQSSMRLLLNVQPSTTLIASRTSKVLDLRCM